MFEMLYTVLSRFIESYSSVVLQISKNWFIVYRMLFIPLSLFIYCLTFFVIAAVLMIVVLIAVPMSAISKLFATTR